MNMFLLGYYSVKGYNARYMIMYFVHIYQICKPWTTLKLR